MATSHDVASTILAELGPIGAMRLQKLLYYVQGWSLAWRNEALFNDEPLEAWSQGPVVHRVWKRYQERPYARLGDPGALSREERALVGAVLEQYGNLTGQQLKQMTHSEPPWVQAREGLSEKARSNNPIALEAMASHFKTAYFGPKTAPGRPIEDDAIQAAINGNAAALAKVIEQGTGASLEMGDQTAEA